MSQSSIAVIGGSGFIGTRLIELLLDAGHTVTIVDKNDSAKYPELRKVGDVRNVDDLVETCRGCDTIYNLAAEHKDDVRPLSLYDDVNVQGARNVCIAAEQLGIKKIIFTSTVAIYGFSENELDENADIAYINDYGRTKYEAEQVFLQWVNSNPEHQLRMVRPTALFGEGSSRKSIAYVGNIAAFLKFLLTVGGQQTEVFNYADKPDLRMNEMVPLVRDSFGYGASLPMRLPYGLIYPVAMVLDWIAAVTNRSFPVSRVRLKKFCSNSQFATGKLKAAGFEPEYELTDALSRTRSAEFDL